jgi:hypothetical protein
MSSAELSEWRVFFQLEAAESKPTGGSSGTGGGPIKVVTAGFPGGVTVE